MRHYQIKQTAINNRTSLITTYLRSIKDCKILSAKEEEIVLSQIKKGNKEAREKLIHSCLRFVVTIAKQYQNKGVDLMDLIEAGNMGLIRAIDSFKNEKNVKFITYAVWWIRKMIIRELNVHNNLISVPEVNLTALNKIRDASNKFELENERPPTIEELSKILQIDQELLTSICNGQFTKIDDSEYETPIISNMISSESENCNVNVSEKIDQLSKQLLYPLEYSVIAKSFGYDGVEYGIEDIAEQLGISKDRVRQIKKRALLKLKNNNTFIEFLKEEV